MESNKVFTELVYTCDLYFVPILLKAKDKTIECWLPLKDKEPLNKQHKTNSRWSVRKSQPSRGFYYQKNKGLSLHVYIYNTCNNIPEDDPRWTYNVFHLCHHWWCCRPSHLAKEPAWVNIMRMCCKFPQCNCDLVSHPDLKCHLKLCLWFPSKAMSLNPDFELKTFKNIALSAHARERMMDKSDAYINEFVKNLLSNVP